MEPVSVNGVIHQWANVKINLRGELLTGITKISYSDTEDIANIYGIGQRPIGRGHGKITCTANITLQISEIEKLVAHSTSGRLQDIPPFDIIVQFMDNDTAMTTHTIRNAQFKNHSIETVQSDDAADVPATEFELIVSHIEWKQA